MQSKRTILLLGIVITLSNTLAQADGKPDANGLNVPREEQTVLGLYLTAKQAFDRWKANPEKVTIIDVRTPEEYIFVGHPVMAWNVPLKFVVYEWNVEKAKPVMKNNPDFVAQVKKIAGPQDTILITCRSGQRSGPAVNMLAEAGFNKAYSIIDGVEGDKVSDPNNVFHGLRMKNGWKNSALPWTCDLNPELMYLPSHGMKTTRRQR